MTSPLDPHFPALHRVHPRGWVNDPNGILRTADGRWHVFFQYNPHSARHSFIHWGHMSSLDLVSWREEPMGLQPRPGEADQDGCWSGIGMLDEGTPTLIYSGVDGTENQLSRVIVSRLDESATTLVEPGTVAADVPQIDGLIGVRDPFLFTYGGKRWAIQGAGIREQGTFVPAVLLFSCEDLEQWEYVGPLLRGEDAVSAEHAPADLWECPQLVQVGEKWVLLLSLWRHPDNVEISTVQVNYLVGDMLAGEEGAPRFRPTGGGRVDLGPDFYAPQVVVDGERLLLWGWSWEGQARTQEQTDAQAWAGTLTFPRELRLEGDVLLSRPAPELAALRGQEIAVDDRGDGDGGGGAGAVFELPVPVRAEVRTRGALRVEILRADETSTEVLAAEAGPATLFLDGSLLELLPDAAVPRTMRCYPEAGEMLRVTGALEAAWSLGRPDGTIELRDGGRPRR